MGRDRHQRRYFTFPGDMSHSLYTEEVGDGPCTVVYKDRESITQLISWLSDRTPRESALRTTLIRFRDRYYPAEGEVGKITIGGPKQGEVDGDRVRDINKYINQYGVEERANAADMYKYLVYPLNITDGERRMLGLVLADGEFKLKTYRDPASSKPITTCPSPRLGIDVGDRIIMINGVTIKEPKWPTGAVADPKTLTTTSTGEIEDFQLLMARTAAGQQLELQGLPDRVQGSEWGYVQGWMLNLERDLINPLALGVDWAQTKRGPWRERVIRGVDGTGLKEAALELEAALKAKGTILVKEDREGRARGISSKWRQFMNLARTPSQFLLGLRCLNVSREKEQS